jgi:Cys-tRNA synthase (O-phospho-L-seryl-tRNA:Cys-tRNA synthase)
MLLLRKQQSPPSLRSQVFTVGSGLRATAAAVGAAVAGLAAGWDAGILIAVIGAVWVVSALLMLGCPRGTAPLAE